MSRIGRLPIQIPAGVEVAVDTGVVRVKGPKGELSQAVSPDLSIEREDSTLRVKRPTDRGEHRALHGLTRSLIFNMVEGVTNGFEKRLEIVGVSFQAKLTGKSLTLNLGYCNPVVREIPKGLTVECPQPTLVIVRGHDRQLVGQFAAEIRRVRPPEPYKGKGVRYVGEVVALKAGKSFVGGEK